MFHLVIPKAKKEPKSIYVLYFLCFFQEKGLIVWQKKTEAILLGDKRWTEPKKYGKISIRNEALKTGADGG